VYAHVDSVNIFLLVEEILRQRHNNALLAFNRYDEIENWLREQWAGIFRDLLKRSSDSQQLSSLSAQVLQLSEINKTLKTYLENLMRAVTPDKSESVIETESSRLSEVQKLARLQDNGAVSFLKNSGIPFEIIKNIIESSNDFKDFTGKIDEATDKRLRTWRIFITLDKAQEDLNAAREILGRPPFNFEPRREQGSAPGGRNSI